MSNFYAIIVGVGPGTSRAIALRFARASYTTVLLARKPSSYEPVMAEIQAAGGNALGITADVTDAASVDAAFDKMDGDLRENFKGSKKLEAVVYNAAGGWARAPFLNMERRVLRDSLSSSAEGLFHIAQKAIPKLLDAVPSSPHPPSLLVTGATASIRGSAMFSTFAAGKFAQRAITQSLAREFGPQGVHVALVLVDGVIDTASSDRDGLLKPEAIADTYWHLHTQDKSCFTQELDIRPYREKF